MATYYPSSSNQGDILPIPYPRDTKLASYPELPLLPGNVMMYLNQASSAGSYSEILSGNALSPRNCVEIPSVGSRNEAVFIPPMGQSVGMQSIGGQSNTATGDPMRNSVSGDPQMVPRTQLGILDGEHNLQCQGLSLSLGTRMPSVVPVPSFQYQYTNPGLSSCLSTHLPVSGEGGGRTISCKGDEGSQSKELRNAEYLASDIFGADHVAVKARALNNSQCSISPKEMHSDPYVYEPSGLASTIFNSKYLKAAQQLLDEVINVRKALKQHASDKHQNFHNFGLDGFKETDGRSNSHSMLPSMNGLSSNPHESNKNSSCELSPVERQGLQDKKRKLLSMLDEVDIRYKQYYHQMQIVVSSFNMVAGCGAAKPYTALALQTISRHFRCFRDAISGQIQVTRRSLGEQDSSPNGQGVGISRLRYVGQQLGQQRALQQLGMTRHAWRPQRGLPESSVSILRAWLFEHFLHPYPKDSEKIMLARQTGLTRSQVANWYINARVRLWKPMVEEMYKEEFGNSEMNSESSPENAPKAARDYSGASDNRGEEFQESLTSTAADSGHPGPFHDSKFDIIPGVAMSGPTEKLGFQNGAHGDDDTDCEVIKLQGDQRPNVYDHSNYPDEIIPPNQNGDGSLMVAAATYHMSELGDFAVGSQVSLALGLRHCETDVLSMSGGTHFRGENTVASSMGPNTADYHCMDPGNQLSQRLRFGNPHQLHDFEA